MMIHYLSKTDPKKLRGTALLRLDFNTEDSWRLQAALPTVKLLARSADKVVILSHKGRPEVTLRGGVPQGPDAKAYSLRKDAATLSRLLRKPVIFLPHFRFGELLEEIGGAKKGSIFLLENIRFHSGEADNDADFAREVAALADYYVNDAFPVSHRTAASVVAITKQLPAYAGLLLEKEIAALSGVLTKPKKPFVVLIGGGKAKDKLEMLHNFGKKADRFLLGGAPANTLLKLRGVDVKRSLVDDDPKDVAALRAFARSKKVMLPADWKMEADRILDIGPATAEAYAAVIRRARTVLWAGPMGYFEKKKFAAGNLAVAKAIAANRKAFSVTGGGETVTFLKHHKLDRRFSFISTGGGAMIEFLSGKKLPGIEALKKRVASRV